MVTMLLRRFGLAAFIGCIASPVAAQTGSSMTLVLVGDDGGQSKPLVPLAGTVIVAQSDALPTGSPETTNKLDLVFDPIIWTNAAVVRWLSGSGKGASAIFTVANVGQSSVRYVLTGITLRSATMTEQGGAAQASFILGASHITVGGTAIN